MHKAGGMVTAKTHFQTFALPLMPSNIRHSFTIADRARLVRFSTFLLVLSV